VYHNYYGFQAPPFAVMPSGGSIYMGSAHREAFAALEWALRDPNGFALIVGEPGTGKTSLIFTLLESPHEGIRIINFSQARPLAGILDSIATELEIKPPYFGAAEFARLVRDRLHLLHTRLVLLFDEAQTLDNHTLEHLRLFANDISDVSGLMQIIFIGQPELAGRLKQPALRALDQRIATRVELLPLGSRELCEYVKHRLLTCGGAGNLFSRAALRSLIRGHVRVPREVNLVCHDALILAYSRGSRRVSAAMIREALRQYRGQEPGAGLFSRCKKYFKATRQQTATVPIFAGVILGSLLLLSGPTGNLHEKPLNPDRPADASPSTASSPSEGIAVGSPLLAVASDRLPLATLAGSASTLKTIHEDQLKRPRSIVVETGDTLSSLAETNLGSSDHEAVQRLLKVNPLLTDPNLIYPGQTVFLPSDSE
jgi:type II secretory pathway predicted ATPase ExeA/LysM repeat protein